MSERSLVIARTHKRAGRACACTPDVPLTDAMYARHLTAVTELVVREDMTVLLFDALRPRAALTPETPPLRKSPLAHRDLQDMAEGLGIDTTGWYQPADGDLLNGVTS